MILQASDSYWAVGITVRCDTHGRWGGHIDFYDDGFCDDNADKGQVATQGRLATRYLVDDGTDVPALRAVLDTLIDDAQRLGIRLAGPAQSRPSLSYEGDGEDPANPPPAGWRELLAAESARLGWTDQSETEEGRR